MKIVNLDSVTTNPDINGWSWLGKYGEYKVYDRTTPSEVIDRAKDAEILIINKTIITAEMMDKMPNLKLIALQSTGYNVVDCKGARERNITVCNIPAYSTNAVAQLVFAFILEIANKVALHNDAVHNDEWCNCPDFCFWKAPLMELDGKTIGIIGFGSIGQRVAEIANAFGMKVIVNTPHPKPDELKKVQFVERDYLFKNADIVTCHTPLTPQTKKMINAEALKQMKKTAILINTSRGPVVDDEALANALNNGDIQGVGLDVLTVEPPSKDNPLLTAKNCYITPHIAWAAQETRDRLLGILEDNIKAYVEGKPQNVVN